MEYVNASNIITVIIALLMLYYLKKLFTADIGENRGFYIATLVVLAVGLYLWRSGAAAEFFASISGTIE